MTEPRRVVVSSARTDRARSAPRTAGGAPVLDAGWTLANDLDEQTELGNLYARTLIRAQFRIAAVTTAAVAVVVTCLPLLLYLAPELGRARLHGVPLPWLVLALGTQPLWIAAAAHHVRQAERVERDFVELVDRP